MKISRPSGQTAAVRMASRLQKDWLKVKGGAARLNAKVAEGLRYQVAGWSLSAFQLADPQVADWLLSFGQDPGLPEAVRKELGHLAGFIQQDHGAGPA